jgi:hypothetical protein
VEIDHARKKKASVPLHTMKNFKSIAVSLFISWVAGLLSILALSYFNFEKPGIQDAIGFGGILLAGSLIVVPLLYLPSLNVMKRTEFHNVRWYPLVLLLASNLPVYLSIYYFGKDNMGMSEQLLFVAGFAATAVTFGFLFPYFSVARNQSR